MNYPLDKKQRIMTQEEIKEFSDFKCSRICNKFKSCGKHRCTDICCNVDTNLGRAGDPEGKHRCTIVCDKKLSCGKHNCTDLCHFGPCKPCQWYSVKPVYCPCGVARLDPPVKCGTPLPSCGGSCKK